MSRGQRDGIERAPGGKFYLRVTVGGKRRRATFATRREAEDARHEVRVRAAAAKLGLGTPPPSDSPSLLGVLDDYAAETEALGRSEAHLRSIRTARVLIERWGDRDAAPFGRADLVALVAWCRAETHSKGRAIFNAVSILRTALRRADLPVPVAPRIDLPRRAPKTFSRADLGKLLEQLPVGSVARTAVELGLRTGARAAELRRIRVGDVDLERGTLVLRKAKGRPGRRGEEAVPISDGLRRHLKAYMAGIPADLPPDAPFLAVGTGAGRRQLGPWSLRRALARAAEAAGLPARASIGWTRAQAATLAREGGVGLRGVAAALGHASTRTTLDHYDESRREESERWSSRLKVARVIDRLVGDLGRKRPTRDLSVEPRKRFGARK